MNISFKRLHIPVVSLLLRRRDFGLVAFYCEHYAYELRILRRIN